MWVQRPSRATPASRRARGLASWATTPAASASRTPASPNGSSQPEARYVTLGAAEGSPAAGGGGGWRSAPKMSATEACSRSGHLASPSRLALERGPWVSALDSKVASPIRFIPVLSITCTLMTGGAPFLSSEPPPGSPPGLGRSRARRSLAVSAESTTISIACLAQRLHSLGSVGPRMTTRSVKLAARSSSASGKVATAKKPESLACRRIRPTETAP
mmetsp:Transcript_47027/g.106507  ORF Transcript_47027/g.106507 Transcript_47027/m.106507 type:complete len:217 (-) Transcript_47027:396-1046(-)